jgi:hypothetical protein
MADLWATVEAAASLGFFATRLSDRLDETEDRSSGDAKLATLFSPAAKLFSSSRIPECLRQALAWGGSDPAVTADLRARLIDAQIEDMYMGPAAVQRRLVSVAMIDTRFLAEFQKWTGELVALAERAPRAGIRSLAEGMRLWQWTLARLRQQADAKGFLLYCDARQGVTFAMADALCGLLAARSLALDVFEIEKDRHAQDSVCASIYNDLSTLASCHAAVRASQACAGLLGGYAPRFPVSSAERGAFAELRTKLFVSLRGMMDTRERIAKFLRAGNAI